MDLKFKLEKFSDNDFKNYFELVNDEKVMEMITERALELEEAKKDFEKLIENNKLDQNFGSFKILNFETNEFLGLAKLEIKTKGNSDAEFAIIDPKNLASRKILTNNGFTSKEFRDFEGLPGEILELKPIN